MYNTFRSHPAPRVRASRRLALTFAATALVLVVSVFVTTSMHRELEDTVLAGGAPDCREAQSRYFAARIRVGKIQEGELQGDIDKAIAERDEAFKAAKIVCENSSGSGSGYSASVDSTETQTGDGDGSSSSSGSSSDGSSKGSSSDGGSSNYFGFGSKGESTSSDVETGGEETPTSSQGSSMGSSVGSSQPRPPPRGAEDTEGGSSEGTSAQVPPYYAGDSARRKAHRL